MRELIRYGLIGATGAGLDFLVFAALVTWTSIPVGFASVVSVSLGITNNYLLNYFFNFPVRNRFWLRLAAFFAVGIFGIVLSVVIIEYLVSLGVSPILAKVISIPPVVVVQFVINKYVSFHPRLEKLLS